MPIELFFVECLVSCYQRIQLRNLQLLSNVRRSNDLETLQQIFLNYQPSQKLKPMKNNKQTWAGRVSLDHVETIDNEMSFSI